MGLALLGATVTNPTALLPVRGATVLAGYG
jgi:hypothetical protein